MSNFLDFMHDIDIISKSPNNFIFQKNSNKTTFGGCLTIVYVLSVIIIFYYYEFKFFSDVNYQITSYVSQKFVLNKNEQLKFGESKKYNPILQIKFSLYDNNNEPLSDKFILYDWSNEQIIPRDKIIKRRVSDIFISVFYQCPKNDNQCEIDSVDRKSKYELRFEYRGFYLDLQSENPLDLLDENIFHSAYLYFNPDSKIEASYKWTVVRCEDEKGLFDFSESNQNKKIKENDNIYIGGKFQKYDTIILSKNTIYPKIKDKRFVFDFKVYGIKHINNFIYEDYKRKEKSIFDYFAYIFSYWFSLYNGLSFFITTLYSQSFDKYKIIENILSYQIEKLSYKKRQTNIINKIKNIEMKDNLLSNDSLIELNANSINDDDNSLIDDMNKNDNLVENTQKNITEHKDHRILPKRTFLDFIFNFCYCCRKNRFISERQQIICDCNDIILKHYSIEKILYNQFLLENLLKDYQWNNPQLKNILNHKSLKRFKNII